MLLAMGLVAPTGVALAKVEIVSSAQVRIPWAPIQEDITRFSTGKNIAVIASDLGVASATARTKKSKNNAAPALSSHILAIIHGDESKGTLAEVANRNGGHAHASSSITVTDTITVKKVLPIPWVPPLWANSFPKSISFSLDIRGEISAAAPINRHSEQVEGLSPGDPPVTNFLALRLQPSSIA